MVFSAAAVMVMTAVSVPTPVEAAWRLGLGSGIAADNCPVPFRGLLLTHHGYGPGYGYYGPGPGYGYYGGYGLLTTVMAAPA